MISTPPSGPRLRVPQNLSIVEGLGLIACERSLLTYVWFPDKSMPVPTENPESGEKSRVLGSLNVGALTSYGTRPQAG
jgi:hypothetical protein